MARMTDNPIIIGAPDEGVSCAKIHAVIAIDHDGNEGICGYTKGNGDWVPMVFAKKELIEKSRNVLIQMARNSPDYKIVVREYYQCRDIETVKP